MRIEPNQLTFLPVTFSWRRDRLWFVGQGNTLQLLDTAMVIEGNLRTISLPPFDWLFRSALSEWTTVTIPYSRITKCDYARYLMVKILIILFLVGPFTLMVIGAINSLKVSIEEVVLLSIFMLPLVFLILYLFFRIFAPRYRLRFQRADGRECMVGFRIYRKKRRKEFEQLLESNRKAAAFLQRDAHG